MKRKGPKLFLHMAYKSAKREREGSRKRIISDIDSQKRGVSGKSRKSEQLFQKSNEKKDTRRGR